MPKLLERGQGFDVEFEGLIVLAFDLELGLEFLDEKLEARDFSFEFLDVAGSGWRTNRLLREAWCRGNTRLQI